MSDSFGKRKIPGDGLPVGPNIFLRTRKCGDSKMSIGLIGQHKMEFLSIATEMESFLVNEETMLLLIHVV